MKRFFKYGSRTGVVLAAILMLTGCLKTSSMYTDFSNPTPLADISVSNLSGNNVPNAPDSLTPYALALPVGSQWVDTAIAVHLSDANHVGDVTFTMALANTDPDFLAMFNYNQQMFTLYNDNTAFANLDSATQVSVTKYVNGFANYTDDNSGDDVPLGQLTLMPDSLYAFPNGMTVTIPNAGVLNIGDFKVNFKLGATDADGNYLFLTHTYVLPIQIADAGGYQIASNFRMIFLVVKIDTTAMGD